MTVGALHLTLVVRESQCLKDKRRVVKSLKDRLRNRFNISVAEVESQDLWQKTELGVAVVGTDERFVASVLQSVENFVRSNPLIELIDTEIEMY
jgi:uncharacterized protein YlxP (DUF503 family)